jgi:aquaporin NIP
LRDRAVARSLVAEFIGTFGLVFAGAGAIMVDAKTHALGHVGVAISFGLVIMVMIYAVGHVSGAHFSPAVSFAFALTRHFPCLAIGGTVGLDAMFGGPITGASMNPARSLSPALISGDSHALWLYVVAPLAGAALGAVAYQVVRGEQPALVPSAEEAR